MKLNLENYQEFFINTRLNFIDQSKIMKKPQILKSCELCRVNTCDHSLVKCDFRNYVFCRACINYNAKIHQTTY